MKLKISIAHKSGVSAEPEILDHTIDEYDEFMIIATDGVWDVVDNNQAGTCYFLLLLNITC